MYVSYCAVRVMDALFVFGDCITSMELIRLENAPGYLRLERCFIKLSPFRSAQTKEGPGICFRSPCLKMENM